MVCDKYLIHEDRKEGGEESLIIRYKSPTYVTTTGV